MSKQTKFYVYALINPASRLPFYIGKGTGGRAFRHLTETFENTSNRHKYATIKGLRNKGLEPQSVILFDQLVESEAHRIEKKLISHFGRINVESEGILTNVYPGGEGGPSGMTLSAETRLKISETRKSESYRAKYTESSKKSIAAITYRTKSQAERSKISAAKMGVPMSDAARNSMSIAASNRDAVYRSNMSAAMKGKPWSEARRAASHRRQPNVKAN